MIHTPKDPSFLPSLKETEQFFGPGSKGNAAFQEFCRLHRIYEFLTKEYVEALSEYLIERVKQLLDKQSKPITILEVCAGDGRLSYYLQQLLEKKIPGQFTYVASDSGEWHIKPLFPVLRLDHEQTLQVIQPDIVMCAWMPKGKDLTADFRDCQRVQEYMLIGNPTECGDPWLTWGEKSKNIPPYERDGFRMEMFGKEFPKQLCMDSELNSVKRHSWTYSFRRI